LLSVVVKSTLINVRDMAGDGLDGVSICEVAETTSTAVDSKCRDLNGKCDEKGGEG
jgi:hypothetical protein